jgi:hypothetical protein
MQRWFLVALVFALSGCVAQMTPYGVSIQPLLDVVLVGPPVVVPPPSQIVVQPLPPVVVVPDRRVYYYNNLYYYYWGESWYYGRAQRGPWHPLRRDYWPSRVEQYDGDHGGHGGGHGGGPKRY